jgi:hypothetical protein
MNIFRKSNNNKLLSKIVAAMVGIAVLFLIAGCSGKYGHLKRDFEVKQAFESSQVPSGYKYYYYGYSNRPYAMFGIESKYILNSKMWREVAPNTAEFKEMANWIWEDYGYNKFGAHVLDPEGNKVGVLYTAIYDTSVKFGDDDRIMVMPGTPYLWGPGDGVGEVRTP